ncbi:hypothetical protein BLA29_007756, partial [Euroglyphus maynei]
GGGGGGPSEPLTPSEDYEFHYSLSSGVNQSKSLSINGMNNNNSNEDDENQFKTIEPIIRRTSAEPYISSYQKQTLNEQLFIEPLIIVDDGDSIIINNNDNNNNGQTTTATTKQRKRHSISVSNLALFANSLLNVASFADAKSSQFISYLKNGCHQQMSNHMMNDDEHLKRQQNRRSTMSKKRENQQKKFSSTNDEAITQNEMQTDDNIFDHNHNSNNNNGQRKSSKNKNYFSKFQSKSRTSPKNSITNGDDNIITQHVDHHDNDVDVDENVNSLNLNERKDSINSSMIDYGFQGKIIRAHLPDDQRTIVPITSGQTIRDVLEKSMNRRKLTSDMCTVYLCDSK